MMISNWKLLFYFFQSFSEKYHILYSTCYPSEMEKPNKQHFFVQVLPDGSPMAMTFWDEVDCAEVDQIETRSLVLVDHNKMTDQVAAHFKPHQVRQVLDHHAGRSGGNL